MNIEGDSINDWSTDIEEIIDKIRLNSTTMCEFHKDNYYSVGFDFGIGKINRNWSFSPNTSLILSQNARPTSSIYFKYAKVRKSDNKLISWAGPWSLDSFVSAPSSQNKIQNSKLLGVRTVIEPLHNLKFESKLDEFIFNQLPLSNSQKEKILIDIYKLEDKKI